MCLIVEKNIKEKIAEEDIICYKNVDIFNTTKGKKLVSEYQYFEYELNKLYKTTFEPKLLTNKVGVLSKVYYADNESEIYYKKFDYIELKVYQKGFHSYKKNYNIFDKDRYSNVKCIIPAGTKYVEDRTGLICSEAIKIIEIL